MRGTIITRIAMMMTLCMCIGCGGSNPLSDTRTEAEGAKGGLFEDVPTITLHTEEREMAGELVEKTMAIYVYLVASKPAAEEIEVKIPINHHLARWGCKGAEHLHKKSGKRREGVKKPIQAPLYHKRRQRKGIKKYRLRYWNQRMAHTKQVLR